MDVELWDSKPPPEPSDWDRTYSSHLTIGPGAMLEVESATVINNASFPVDAGEYQVDIAGRNIDPGPRGKPRTSWRVRLWLASKPE